MKEKIIVNSIEIEKKIINQFLIEGRKLEAVKFICEKANIDIATSKYIVELFQDNNIGEFDYEDLFAKQKEALKQPHLNSRRLFSSQTKRRILILCLLIFAGFLFLKYYIGFQHIGMHLETLKNNVLSGYSDDADEAMITDDTFSQSASDTIAALETPTIPIDTVMWNTAIKSGDYIPDMVLEDISRYKKRDFSKLVVATYKPTDKQAEEAIVHFYQAEIVSLLQQYKAHIKIGVCYNAPHQNVQEGNLEIARVTAMVSAFNMEVGNLRNIQAPLNVIYDFVKYQSDPDRWYLEDFSQSIPYDYNLNTD